MKSAWLVAFIRIPMLIAGIGFLYMFLNLAGVDFYFPFLPDLATIYFVAVNIICIIFMH
jgi:hypothetical protein